MDLNSQPLDPTLQNVSSIVNHVVIALDGPSGTGKSTTAKLVAERLGLIYLDTGAMYRALTWKAQQEGVSHENISSLHLLAQQIQLDFDSHNQIMIDGVVRASEIRTPEVSAQVSLYCQNALVREVLTQKQREFGQKSSCILDGRDIGTVVFPNAQFKFFMVADYRVRAERRALELKNQGIDISVDEVEANLKERDHLDSTREIAPLVKAQDAQEIDTTRLSITQQVEHIVRIVSGGASDQWSQS